MTSTFLKAEKVVATGLGLLLRDLSLPQLVWRDPVGRIVRAKNDTVTVRLPAYAPAHSRALRSGDARTKDAIFERSVDISLDTDIYKWIGVDDETLSLDIEDFGQQVLNPIMSGVVRSIEDKLADTIKAASYENEIAFSISTDDVWSDIVLPAMEYLDNAYVPNDERYIVVGSAARRLFLDSDKLVDASRSGTTQTLRQAVIGNLGGFTIVPSNAIPAEECYAFHRTAYALTSQIPDVPAGAPWGAQMRYEGFALRAVRAFDIENVEDQLAVDSWLGCTAVADHGHYDADPDDGGKFVPVEDPDNPIDGETDDWANDDERVVRAVKVSIS